MSLQLTYDKEDVLYWQRIPVPAQYKLPHGWQIFNAVFAVPPAGPQLCALITERWKQMTSAERHRACAGVRPRERPLQQHWLMCLVARP
jgi:hypothetical protein